MSLKLQIARHLDVTIMELSGRVTLGEGSSTYRDAVRTAVWDGHRKLALDYGQISYQDSSGNGEMVSAFTIVSNSGGELVVFDLTKRVRDLLKITKLYSVFRVFDSREAALEYLDSTRSSEIQIFERRYLDVSVLEIQGAVTEKFGADRISVAIRTALNSGASSVVLLCLQVLEIGPAGMQRMQIARSEIKERGGDLLLAGLEARLLNDMADKGVTNDLPTFKTIHAALNSLGIMVDLVGSKVKVTRAV